MDRNAVYHLESFCERKDALDGNMIKTLHVVLVYESYNSVTILLIFRITCGDVI